MGVKKDLALELAYDKDVKVGEYIDQFMGKDSDGNDVWLKATLTFKDYIDRSDYEVSLGDSCAVEVEFSDGTEYHYSFYEQDSRNGVWECHYTTDEEED